MSAVEQHELDLAEQWKRAHLAEQLLVLRRIQLAGDRIDRSDIVDWAELDPAVTRTALERLVQAGELIEVRIRDDVFYELPDEVTRTEGLQRQLDNFGALRPVEIETSIEVTSGAGDRTTVPGQPSTDFAAIEERLLDDKNVNAIRDAALKPNAKVSRSGVRETLRTAFRRAVDR